MQRRLWIIGMACFTAGLLVGGAAVYFWTRAAAQPGAEVSPSDLPPTPSEAEAKSRLQTLLDTAGLQADVHSFRRTDWHHDTIKWDGVGPDGKLTPANPPYHLYRIAYEAEVSLHRDGQIKENFTVMWSPENTADGKAPMMIRNEVGTFRAGERKVIRGTIRWKLVGKDWQADPKEKIDAPGR